MPRTKSIEAQHGLFVERAKSIYSFSHLTFHEYFTARKIVTSANPDAIDDKTLQGLANHINEKRWREVFLLTVGMLESADSLLQLMKQRIDELVITDDKLQQFLTWVEKKSRSVETRYKPVAIRAFYLDLSQTLDFDLSRTISISFDLDLSRTLNLSPELKRSLRQLKGQLPGFNDKEAFKHWWQENGKAWTEQFRAVIIKHRNIGHDWQFSKEQKELLRQYYDANKLLVDCLNSECYVSREVRQHIEDKLLLPVQARACFQTRYILKNRRSQTG